MRGVHAFVAKHGVVAPSLCIVCFFVVLLLVTRRGGGALVTPTSGARASSTSSSDSVGVFYNAQHAPIGAFSSFTFGFKGGKGGLGVQLGKPADQNVYIALQSRDGSVLEALPFADGLDGASTAGVSPFADAVVSRTLGAASDVWTAGDLTFAGARRDGRGIACCYTVACICTGLSFFLLFFSFPRRSLQPRAGRAGPLRAVLRGGAGDGAGARGARGGCRRQRRVRTAAAGFVRLRRQFGASNNVSNFFFKHLNTSYSLPTQGNEPGGGARRMDSALLPPGVVAFAHGLTTGYATDARGAAGGQGFSLSDILGDPNLEGRTFGMGGHSLVSLTAPASVKSTFRFVVCFHKGGRVTSGLDASFYYTKYFSSLEAVASFGLKHFAALKAAALAGDAAMGAPHLGASRSFALSMAVRSYFGSTQLLALSNGKPLWVVYEGECA